MTETVLDAIKKIEENEAIMKRVEESKQLLVRDVEHIRVLLNDEINEILATYLDKPAMRGDE